MQINNVFENRNDQIVKNENLEIFDKKRKNDDIFMKNCINKCKKSPKLSNDKRKSFNNIIENTKLNIYARVLLDTYRTIPNVIKILDNIIQSRASTISPIGPTGFSYNAFDEVEKVISLTERKEKLLNLYIISKKMLDSLSPADKDFAVKKFIQKHNSDDLATILNLNKRNIFRKSNSVITKLCYYLLSQNWTADFLEMQIGDNEPWIKDLFKKRADQYKANLKRSNTKKLCDNLQ